MPKILTDEEKIASYERRIKNQTDYLKNKCRRIAFNLNKEIDKDIIKHLDKQDNINGYLKDLVRKDINK